MKRGDHANDLLERAALRACRTFLVPVARLLLRYGVGYSAFAEQAKWAFVRVAVTDQGAMGRPTSMSRIAELTGIGRKEATRLRTIGDDDADYLGSWWRHLGDILQRWHTEPDFLDSRGGPLDLAIEGNLGFSELVRRYGGPISASVALRELRRLGTVHDLADGRIRVTARALLIQGGDAESMHHFGETLANVAATMMHNFSADRVEPPFVEKFVWADGLDERARARFRRICADQGYKFLEAMDDWLSSNCDPATARSDESLSLGVGIYYFEKSQREPPLAE